MKHSILFTGHMIDHYDRLHPRFPASKEKMVMRSMKERLIKLKNNLTEEIAGIAGGACGGDILFHELCRQLDIPSEMYLALPVIEFKKESVSFAGIGWDERFDKLITEIRVHILDEKEDKNSNVWERANLWMLNKGLKHGGNNMTLLALWDGKGGDGSGGTEHMVKTAKAEGATVEIIYINKI